MKRRYIIVSTVLLALAVSCAKENTPQESGAVHSIKVSLSSALKTSIGPSQSGVRKVLWSEGDKISVNGAVSDALPAAYDGSASAEFTFQSLLEAPYNVLYPGSTDNTITLPAVQNYVEGSFDPAAAPLYGCGDVKSIQLRNLCDILRFSFTGKATLDRIELQAVGGEKIAGTAAMNLSEGQFDGNFEFATGAASGLTLAFPAEGLALGTTATEIFVPVIKGTYTQGFTATVHDKEGNEMELRFLSSGRTLTGSKVLEFPVKEFKAGSEVIYVLGEYNAEQLEFDCAKVTINATIPSGMIVTADKRAGIIEVTPEGVSSVFTSEGTVIENGTAKFSFSIDPNPGKSDYRYIFVYPSTSANVESAAISIKQPPFQQYTAQGCDPEANSAVIVTPSSATQGGEFDASLAGKYGCLKVKLANLPADEVVRNVTVTSNNAAIRGNYSVDMATGTISDGFTDTGLTINAAPADGSGDSAAVWIVATPAAVTSWKATLVTDKKIYKWTLSSALTIAAGQETICTLDVAQATVQNGLRILLIGNSFTQDACFQLPGVIVGAGINNVEVTQCYYGGRTVPEYNDGWETSSDYTKHTALGGQSSMTNTSSVCLKTVAESGRWDIVTIQEHTGNYRAWSWNETEKNHIRELMEKVAATQEVRPQFYYIMSQTYYNMNKIGSGSVPYITWTDQAGMYDVTVAFAKRVIAEIPFVNVISTGTTLQNLRQTHIKNAMCLTRDGYHMDYGISRYAAACCMYQTMLYPRYGVALSENTYRTVEFNTTDGSYTTPITDDNVPVAQQAALDAVAHPFEITYQEFKDGGQGEAGSGLGTVDHGTI